MTPIIISNFLKLITILLGITSLSAYQIAELPTAKSQTEHHGEATDLKLAAFQILQTKCNTCHEKKNRRRVFTLKNMSDLAPKIYKQVFIKKRMPKGNEIRLTEEEYNTLKKWLFTKKIN